MLSRRGLPPAHLVPLASRQSLQPRVNASRKFSSAPRTTLSATSRRTSPLQSVSWRAGTASPSYIRLTASTVRHGSWYAPWTWGSSGTPPTAATPTGTADEFASLHRPTGPESAPTPAPEPVVTTYTPELAPAGIDQPPVVDGTVSQQTPASVEELLQDSSSVADFASIDPTQQITHYGQLKELGLDYGLGPTAFFEWLIEHVYVMSGYGWGASIIASTIIIRGGLFYFQVQSSDNMAKMASMKPILEGYQKELEEAIRTGDEEKKKVYRQKQLVVGQEVGYKLMRGLAAPLSSGVFGYGAFRCLRGMSSLPVPGLTEGGFLWFHDLAVADPIYILPTVTGAIFYIMMKTGGEAGIANETAQAEGMKIVQKVMPFVMALITAFQPAGIQLYFFCSTAIGFLTARLLRLPRFRRLLKITRLPSKASHEVYKKVVEGKVPIGQLRDKDGKIKYQAPNPPSPIQNRGLNLRPGTKLPAHLAPPVLTRDDPDVDFKRGPPSELRGKFIWVSKHYRPSTWYKRIAAQKAREAGREDLVEKVFGDKATPSRMDPKRRVQDYEIQRRKRFENRK